MKKYIIYCAYGDEIMKFAVVTDASYKALEFIESLYPDATRWGIWSSN